MAKYELYVFCDECSIPHPMGNLIDIYDGPVDKASIGDFYADKEIPFSIARLLDKEIICPNTNKWIRQRDTNQIFLVHID